KCHSERREESLMFFHQSCNQQCPEMFRFAQHDSPQGAALPMLTQQSCRASRRKSCAEPDPWCKIRMGIRVRSGSPRRESLIDWQKGKNRHWAGCFFVVTA